MYRSEEHDIPSSPMFSPVGTSPYVSGERLRLMPRGLVSGVIVVGWFVRAPTCSQHPPQQFLTSRHQHDCVIKSIGAITLLQEFANATSLLPDRAAGLMVPDPSVIPAPIPFTVCAEYMTATATARCSDVSIHARTSAMQERIFSLGAFALGARSATCELECEDELPFSCMKRSACKRRRRKRRIEVVRRRNPRIRPYDAIATTAGALRRSSRRVTGHESS